MIIQKLKEAAETSLYSYLQPVIAGINEQLSHNELRLIIKNKLVKNENIKHLDFNLIETYANYDKEISNHSYSVTVDSSNLIFTYKAEGLSNVRYDPSFLFRYNEKNKLELFSVSIALKTRYDNLIELEIESDFDEIYLPAFKLKSTDKDSILFLSKLVFKDNIINKQEITDIYQLLKDQSLNDPEQFFNYFFEKKMEYIEDITKRLENDNKVKIKP